MKIKAKVPEPIGFQLAPMLDVVFLLLIFFVVTQKFILNEQDLKVRVPTAPKSEDEAQRAINELIVNVREENEKLIITMDGSSIVPEGSDEDPLEILRIRLRNQVQLNAHQPVRIRADAEMRWQRVADVISTCTKAGVYNLSFSKQVPNSEQQ